ncbi:MAG: hypothetical protein R3C61_16360 [Bacteroidia bacterium]
MDFNELSAQWQQKKLPLQLDQAMAEQITHFEAQLKKEKQQNLLLAGGYNLPHRYPCAAIYKKSNRCFAFNWNLVFNRNTDDDFWFRQTNIQKSMAGDPSEFVKTQLSRLRYNLLVTNVFMPLYRSAGDFKQFLSVCHSGWSR